MLLKFLLSLTILYRHAPLMCISRIDKRAQEPTLIALKLEG